MDQGSAKALLPSGVARINKSYNGSQIALYLENNSGNISLNTFCAQGIIRSKGRLGELLLPD